MIVLSVEKRLYDKAVHLADKRPSRPRGAMPHGRRSGRRAGRAAAPAPAVWTGSVARATERCSRAARPASPKAGGESGDQADVSAAVVVEQARRVCAAAAVQPHRGHGQGSALASGRDCIPFNQFALRSVCCRPDGQRQPTARPYSRRLARRLLANGQNVHSEVAPWLDRSSPAQARDCCSRLRS